jgi:hypothetical protein
MGRQRQDPRNETSRREATAGGTQARKTVWLAVTAFLVVSALVFAFGTTAHTPYTPEVQGQPSLQVNQAEVDLGDVKIGRYVSASFELQNVGDTPLRFSREPWVTAVAGC